MRGEAKKTKPVPLLDLKAQYRSLRDEVLPVIERVCEDQAFVLGSEVEAFENEVANYCGVEHAVGVSSGTDALLLSLMALDIGPGDEVLTSAFTFFATAGSVHRTGARVVLADIDPATFNVDPNRLEAGRSSRTRAVIPVHLFGRCAEMDAVLDVAERYNLAVIEDAAQAIGSELDKRRAGSFGDTGCFSFFPSKNLGAFGDGGMITAKDSALAHKIRIMRMHGETSKYHHELVGGCFRLDALQAAILRVKLRHLDAWSEARKRNAEEYHRLFAEAGLDGQEIQVPEIPSHRHIFNQYVIRVQRRDELMDHLRTQGVGCQIYYPIPIHLQACFRSLGYRQGDFPHSEKAAAEVLALPVFPEMTIEQRVRVVDCVREFYRS